MADQVEILSNCAAFKVGDIVDISDSNAALIDRLLERGKAKLVKDTSVKASEKKKEKKEPKKSTKKK